MSSASSGGGYDSSSRPRPASPSPQPAHSDQEIIDAEAEAAADIVDLTSDNHPLLAPPTRSSARTAASRGAGRAAIATRTEAHVSDLFECGGGTGIVEVWTRVLCGLFADDRAAQSSLSDV